MEINVTDPTDFTIERLRSLIASADDSKGCQLRINKGGIVFISYVIGNQELDDIAFKFETFGAGGGYAGPEAAEDNGYISWIYNSIKDNLPINPKGNCYTITE